MTDRARSQITNGIWLCANCHDMVDRDEQEFPQELLFRWRKEQEHFTVMQLRKPGGAIRWEVQQEMVQEFASFPPRIRQIVLDKPKFWEGELTLALLEHFLRPLRQRLADVRSGASVIDTTMVYEGQETAEIRRRLDEAMRFVRSIEVLYTKELIPAWGPEGEPGDQSRILHVCRQIENTVRKMVEWEEALAGVFLCDDNYQGVFDSIKNAVGMQVDETLKVNDVIADVVHKASKLKSGETLVIEHTIVFALPEDFSARVNEEIDKVRRSKGLP